MVPVAPSSIEWSTLVELPEVLAIEAGWRDLANGAWFRGPDWLLPWWHAYHRMLGAELHLLVGRADGELVAVMPLYRRTGRSALLDVREIRMMGDAGPRPPGFDCLVRPGWEERAGTALAKYFVDSANDWDLIDLEPLADPSRMRATLLSRLAAAGFGPESSPSAAGACRIALGHGVGPQPPNLGAVVHRVEPDANSLRRAMSTFRRLSRLEWADRDEVSPLADAEAGQLLEEVAIAGAETGRAHMLRLDDATGEALALALTIDDGTAAVVVAMTVDPQAQQRGLHELLIWHAAKAAAERGRSALDLVMGGVDIPLPNLPTSQQHALAVRVWAPRTGARVSKTYRTVQRRAKRAVTSPGVAAAQARAAWTRIRSAASNVAQYDRFSLYRGQLWTRGIAAPTGLTMELFSAEGFAALDEPAQVELVEQLEWLPGEAEARWARGDFAVLARLSGRAAGVVWAASGEVAVESLGRNLQLSKHEALIHGAYVSASARGRQVAPVMLEFLARSLRERDVYRSWALIAADNQASQRAFQKASYTPVCDVIYARMASVDRLVVRPPDPEAKALLGV